MKRILLSILLIFLIVGCGAAVPEVETAVDDDTTAEEAVAVEEPTTAPIEEAPTEEVEAPPTDEPTTEPVVEPTEEVVEEDAPATEAADLEVLPTTAEEAAIIRDSDWVKGAENGRVVFIEYGDFQ